MPGAENGHVLFSFSFFPLSFFYSSVFSCVIVTITTDGSAVQPSTLARGFSAQIRISLEPLRIRYRYELSWAEEPTANMYASRHLLPVSSFADRKSREFRQWDELYLITRWKVHLPLLGKKR